MGPVCDALRVAGRVYHQPAPFYAPTQQPVLGEPDFLSQSWRVFIESRHRHDALRLSAILARGPPAVDYWHGADGACASRENQILARQRLITLCHPQPDFCFNISAQDAVVS